MNEHEMTEFEKVLAKRAAEQNSSSMDGVEDLSGEMEESAGADQVMKARQMQDQQALEANKAQGGGGLEKAGQVTTAAGAAGGNPYVAGAGLALQTVGAVDSAHRNSEQAKIDAYNKKTMAQRSAIRNIFA